MKKLKFTFKKGAGELYMLKNMYQHTSDTTYPSFQTIKTLFGSYMFLRDVKTKKILNHQEFSTTFIPSKDRSAETNVASWPYTLNNLYADTKRYCLEQMGVSVVSYSNGTGEYQSSNRSIFDMDTSSPHDWSKKTDVSTDSMWKS